MELIYGLPLQTVEKFFTFTLQKVIELNPDRLSVFNYAHLPSRFAGQAKIKEHMLRSRNQINNSTKNYQKFWAMRVIEFIGMDHFAKPDDELAIAQQNGVLHRKFSGLYYARRM